MIAFALALVLSSQLNPAVTQANVQQTICAVHYTEGVRNVTGPQRRLLFELAGVPESRRRNYIVDHKINLSLGGSNATSNLQLQTRHQSYMKDGMERHLSHEVCAGRISLHDAQEQINNWRPR